MSAIEITCPTCGSDEHLHGRPDADVIHITCTACDLTWDRLTAPHCATCGSRDMVCVPEVLVERSRGTQLSTPLSGSPAVVTFTFNTTIAAITATTQSTQTGMRFQRLTITNDATSRRPRLLMSGAPDSALRNHAAAHRSGHSRTARCNGR